ncbi:hypothetical protein FNYG_01647 [Fusarium nygamai]|uniref:Lysine-specific metallo-endopeptidase domain-containing protein n=1 Tax=Gibberella nygamai TaxID=42673 RepID=A0A2K0WS52_GIBNY|nr:hypothetical protein FNYG_01647 [Fusarium nygamai]
MWPKLVFLFSFLALVFADNDDLIDLKVTQVFRVKSGTELGGCDNFDVNRWFSDARVLVKAAQEALSEAQQFFDKGNKDSQIESYLRAFFRFDPEDVSAKSTLEKMIEDINDVDIELKNTDGGDDMPWVFCDSTFAEQKSWSSKALVEGTGAPDPDGLTIKQAFPDVCQENYTKRKAALKKEKSGRKRMLLPREFYPFWVDDFKQYRYAEDVTYCNKAGKKNMAGTDDNMQPNTITFCTMNWKDHKYKGLSDFPPVVEEGLSLNHFAIGGLTFLHESFHYALLNEHTPDTAYNLEQITGSAPLDDGKIITTDQAVANPESWTMFALAWYLGSENKDFTFASSMSKRL